MNKLDQAISAISDESVPEDRIEAAAARLRNQLFSPARGGSGRLRSCLDYQALIPCYLSKTLSAGRSLLLQDHTRECPACRLALDQARGGNVRTLARPATPLSRTIPIQWVLAAALVLTLAAAALLFVRTSMVNSGKIAVQTVTGILYLVSDGKVTPIFAGREIPEGARVRTAKDSTAVVRLADGSLVELNERAEIAVARPSRGTAIHLDRGGIIVQAAKQRYGTLDVLTQDCAVSVKGTIFAVDRGTKGSRVSVVEGTVQVARGSEKQMLKPGQQVSTDPSAAQTSVQDAVSWSRDSVRYLSLLGEFSVIQKGLDAMPSPAVRQSSRLLAYLPEDTVLYAAIPNMGSTLAEAERLFNARLQESPVLREWWDQQKEGPKMQEMIQKLRTFSDYLGDEIVFSISGDWAGNYSHPMLLAEVKKPGLATFLNNEFRHLELQGGNSTPRVVAIRKAIADSPDRIYKRRNQYVNGQRQEGPMLVGVTDKLLAVAWDQNEMDRLGQRVAEPSAVVSDGLLGRVRQVYDSGAGWLLCVNMEQIARDTVDRRKGSNGPKLPPGLDGMRYLIVERKDVTGKTENQATLTFNGRRSGMAGWLSEPAPMGSLDFVSPNATLAVSMVLRSPQSLIGDLLRSMAQHDPNFQDTLDRINNEGGLRISPALGEPLGGEFSFAMDGPVLPLPSWKLAVEVYSPERLQFGIQQVVDAANKQQNCTDCRLTLAKENVSGRTYYTISSAKFSYEIDYTFVDGYLLAAPSRTLLTTAIQNRATGYVLSHSEAFRSQLPTGGNLNFSGIVYHNLGSVLKPFADQISSVGGTSTSQRASIQALAENTGPGLIYIYGKPDSISIASSSGFFGLNWNSLALPGLLGRAMHSQ